LTCELDNAVAVAVAATAAAATRIISENANQNQNENTLQRRDALLMIAYIYEKHAFVQKKCTQETGLKVAKASAIKHVHIKRSSSRHS